MTGTGTIVKQIKFNIDTMEQVDAQVNDFLVNTVEGGTVHQISFPDAETAYIVYSEAQ